MNGENDRPIFILSAGWRAGSTLLQRILCSHPDIMIWGENRALCSDLAAAQAKVDDLQELSRSQQTRSKEPLHQSWIPMINPGRSDWEMGLRRLFGSLYADPSLRMGARRWGFKEVRHDMSIARFLRGLFPQARFVLLVRHPAHCLASARATTGANRGLLVEAGGAQAFLDHWRRLALSFADEAEPGCCLCVRYEDLIADPDASLTRIAGFVDVDENRFDRSVFEHRLRGWKREPFLAAEDREALRDPRLWDAAARHGYMPEDAVGLLPTAGSNRRRDAIRRLVRAIRRVVPGAAGAARHRSR